MIKTLIILVIVIFSSVSYGILIGHYQIFPYDLLSESKALFTSNFVEKTTKNAEFYESDVNSLIQISDKNDLEEKRSSLIQYIWKQPSLPTNSNLNYEKEIEDIRYSDFTNLSSIDKISINMENNVNSISYLFHSKNPNGHLVIYSEGHSGDFIHGSETIQNLLSDGFDVLAFSMPLIGMNNQPVVNSDFGKIKLTTHNHFQFIESETFSTIKYFLHPITISLNFMEEEYDYLSYSMIGISGGGWTTTIYSAIDERISHSFSVAGSLPIFLRNEPKDLGDYEQTLPELYSISNYLELYIMSSYGENRLHVQLFNQYDPCCFSGTNFESYEDIILQKIRELDGGNFIIYLDTTHDEHKISEYAQNKILIHLP